MQTSRYFSISRAVFGGSLIAILIAPCLQPLAFAAVPDQRSWEQLQQAGTEAFTMSSYGDAERTLRQAVIKAASFGETDMRFAKSLGSLATLLTVRGRFSEAEPLFEEEFHIKEANIGKDNIEIIPDIGSLIHFYIEHGTASKADPLTEQLLDIVEGKIKEHNQQAKGRVTLQKGQPLTGWAGTAALKVRDPLLEWAITCDSLGDAYRAHNGYDLAERLYKAALDVKTSVLGPEHLSLANSYDSLGTISLEKNQDTDAEYFYKDSLDMTAGILSGDSPQVFSRLDKLAKCYIKEKKYDEAEKLYLKAQDLWKDGPSKIANEARAKYVLGSLYVEEKKYAEAKPILEQALHQAEEYYGADSISLLPYLQRCADVNYYLGDKELTGQLKTRANTISGVGITQ